MIVDDEPLARKGLFEYIQDIPYLQHVGSFENALTAGGFLKDHTADLILLDIRMPKLSGIDFLKTMEAGPLIIFTTAFTEYAIEGYELNVIDYLVKPIAFDRFQKATQKAFDLLSLREKATQPEDDEFFFIKSNQKIEKIIFNDVLYIEAMQNYCVIHVPNQKFICYITLSAVLEKLPANRFLKVHKSFIVAIDKIKTIHHNEIVVGNVSIPVSRTLKQELMNRVTKNNLLKR
jgi:DNA-binding LytR/AlgR family response regulator